MHLHHKLMSSLAIVVLTTVLGSQLFLMKKNLVPAPEVDQQDQSQVSEGYVGRHQKPRVGLQNGHKITHRQILNRLRLNSRRMHADRAGRSDSLLPDDYRSVFLRQILQDLLSSPEELNTLLGLPVAVRLDCSEEEEREERWEEGMACVSEVEVFDELERQDIEIESITVPKLRRVLFNIIRQKWEERVNQNMQDLQAHGNPETHRKTQKETTDVLESKERSEGHGMPDQADSNVSIPLPPSSQQPFPEQAEGDDVLPFDLNNNDPLQARIRDRLNKYNAIVAQRNSRENPLKPPDWSSVSEPPSQSPVAPTDPQSLLHFMYKDVYIRKEISGGLQSHSLHSFLGYRMKGTSLAERGFEEVFDFNVTELKERVKNVREVMEGLSPVQMEMGRKSLNPDVLARGKYQRRRTDFFCQQNKISRTLPTDDQELDILFKHLLYDDTKKVVFCYVPKNGCSNMKRMMLILNGKLPPDSSSSERPPEALLGSVQSFRNLTRHGAMYRLENYYKFAIIRNPMERLLSGYRNKLEPAFNASLRKKFPDRVKVHIMKLFEEQKIMNWIGKANYLLDVHPSFSSFLQFMSRYPLNSYNEHFMPFMQLCSPCAVNYDLLINMKSINYDIYAVMKYLQIPSAYYPNVISHKTTPTTSFLESYFKAVPAEVKATLYRTLEQELGFYYSMHPEEWGTHKLL